ncbi:hypothetical protein ACPC54_23925 [Kitasatospora sp. NPDC094028]
MAEKDERIAWLESRVAQLNLRASASLSEFAECFARCERISDDCSAYARRLVRAELVNGALVAENQELKRELSALQDVHEKHYRDLAKAAGATLPAAASVAA